VHNKQHKAVQKPFDVSEQLDWSSSCRWEAISAVKPASLADLSDSRSKQNGNVGTTQVLVAMLR
jgi:hypothetical protein